MLNTLGSAGFLRLAGHVTVRQILERDDFQQRLEANRPLALHEVMYPLVMAYDSVALEADVELGGTDQKFNLLMGRNLQREYGQESQVAMITPLLEGTDGVQKMSKSLGNYIGINEPPQEIFGKVMSISDDLMWRYYELCTDLSVTEIAALRENANSGGRNPRDIKADLAKHIVETKAGHFEPAKFEDHYEAALQELLEKKQKGQPISAAKKAPSSNVYNLMDALRASIKGDQRTPAEKPTKAAKKPKSAKPSAKRKAG